MCTEAISTLSVWILSKLIVSLPEGNGGKIVQLSDRSHNLEGPQTSIGTVELDRSVDRPGLILWIGYESENGSYHYINLHVFAYLCIIKLVRE